MEEVGAAIRSVGTADVLARFRSLGDGDIIEKGPGDLVTVADRACEAALTPRLRAIRDVPVIGEEATAADPSLLDLLGAVDAVWLLDPIDGTANFAAGDPRFAVMVALVEHGVAQMAWIWYPVADTMLTAHRDHGIRRDGAPHERSTPGPQRQSAPSSAPEPQGIIKRKYMPAPTRERLATPPAALGTLVPGRKSAAVEYRALIEGEIDYLAYWRTLPWDHAPGGLLAEEAGYRVGRLDGSAYRPGDGRNGLVAARPDLWDDVAETITTALE